MILDGEKRDANVVALDATKKAEGAIGAAAIGSILILAFCNLVSFADRQLTAIMAGPIKTHLALDNAQIALLGGTAFALMYGLAGIPAGLAADRFVRKRMIACAVLFWSICTAICGLAGSFAIFFVARVGVGIGEAVLLPCAFSLIYDLVPARRRGLAFALFGLGIPAGMALGLAAGGVLNDFFAARPDLGGSLADLASWQKTFLTLASLGIPASLLALFIVEPARQRLAAKAGEAAGEGASRLAVVAFFAAMGFAGIAFHGINFWTPSLLGSRFDLPTGAVGVRMGLSTIAAGTLGMFLIGAWTDREERLRGTAGVARILAVAFLGFAVAALLIGFGDNRFAWLGVSFFYFFGLGFTTAASALVLRLGGVGRSGIFAAAYGLVINVCGHGLGPLGFGAAMDNLPLSQGSILAMAAVTVASLAILAALVLSLGSRRPA